MKFYVAARYALVDEVKSVQDRLKKEGHEIIVDWLKHEPCKPYDKNPGISSRQAIDDVAGARECDYFVLLSDEAGTGMYVELGAAISHKLDHGKPQVYVIGQHLGRSMFYFHPVVKRRNSIDDVLSEIPEKE